MRALHLAALFALALACLLVTAGGIALSEQEPAVALPSIPDPPPADLGPLVWHNGTFTLTLSDELCPADDLREPLETGGGSAGPCLYRGEPRTCGGKGLLGPGPSGGCDRSGPGGAVGGSSDTSGQFQAGAGSVR